MHRVYEYNGLKNRGKVNQLRNIEFEKKKLRNIQTALSGLSITVFDEIVSSMFKCRVSYDVGSSDRHPSERYKITWDYVTDIPLTLKLT